MNQDMSKNLKEVWGSMMDHASDVANEYYQLIVKDHTRAVSELPVFIQKARDTVDNRAFVECLVGPEVGCVGQVKNLMGALYPFMDERLRVEALEGCLDYLNGLRYDYAQDQVELIDEPWLVGDIIVSKPLYWCGFKYHTMELSQNRSWSEFKKHTLKTPSRFWQALAVTWHKYSTPEIREGFYQEYPDLVDRTLDAIAAITFDHAESEMGRDGTPLNEGIHRRLQKYDHALHDRVLEKIEEKKWIKLD